MDSRFDFPLKLGALCEFNFQLQNPECKNWQLHCFALTADTPTFFSIPDSGFATPARYVQEIFHRLCQLDKKTGKTAKFIFNPSFTTNRGSLLLSLHQLATTGPDDSIAVYADQNGLPVGYYLPATIETRQAHFLALLSAADANTDANCLSLIFHTKATLHSVRGLALENFGNNGFAYRTLRNTYLSTCAHACTLLADSHKGKNNAPSFTLENIPFTAVMPFHAGDVLFFSLAHNQTSSCFSRIAVNEAYEPIVRNNAEHLTSIPIKAPPPNRQRPSGPWEVLPDHVYYEGIKPQLPANSFYIYFRQSRNYNSSDFHLIDQFAFALGAHQQSVDSLLFHHSTPIQPAHSGRRQDKGRILLHFDGGWPLKVYPRRLQENLIGRLLERGHTLTILAAPNEKYDAPCEVVYFSNYDNLMALLRQHDLLVGMDSFPCHCAAHVAGIPTICLFSSTKPANSDAPRRPNYRALEVGLSCRPCCASAECPLYGGPDCKNFVTPDRVAHEVEAMLRRPQVVARASAVHLSPAEMAQPAVFPCKNTAHPVLKINLQALSQKAWLASKFLPVYYASPPLLSQFINAVRKEGTRGAVRRTMRYLKRRREILLRSENERTQNAS